MTLMPRGGGNESALSSAVLFPLLRLPLTRSRRPQPRLPLDGQLAPGYPEPEEPAQGTRDLLATELADADRLYLLHQFLLGDDAA